MACFHLTWIIDENKKINKGDKKFIWQPAQNKNVIFKKEEGEESVLLKCISNVKTVKQTCDYG